jgi:DNA-directed RNA polymerase specialized sigma24 family protein
VLSGYLMEQQEGRGYSEDKLELRLLYEDVFNTEDFQLIKELAVDGKSHLEMAQARGISVSACKKRVQRAKEKLWKKMKKDVT